MSCPDAETVVAVAEGRLTGVDLAAAEEHLASCAQCTAVVAVAHQRLVPGERAAGRPQPVAFARGASIGRYVMLELVGKGGMGEVYAAYDPDLDRKVAVKFLRSRASSTADSEARILREAQAAAKLSHPNVVVVHDVGTFGDDVFIAMEFVDGQTLAQWLQQEGRDHREILRVFLAAGRGLAAAHEAGLVHRDFKPENVMIARDGQVRVMDFGLARQVLAEGEQALSKTAVGEAMEHVRAGGAAWNIKLSDPGSPDPETAAGAGGYLKAKLTRTGAQVGTPAYMAPEQFLVGAGARVDARADQFSFSVALYEALFGERPFQGNTVAALRANVLNGVVRPPRKKGHVHVPPWIRQVLLRGLAPDPNDRFPSMDALLGSLEDDPRARRRRRLMGALALSIVAALVLGAHRVGSRQHPLCSAVGARLAGIWEPDGAMSERKQSIRRAFAQTGKSYEGQVYATTSHLLDDYVGRWSAMYKDACEATHVRGEQSAAVLDLRMACLQDRLEHVRALTDVLANADEQVVVNAPAAVGQLASVDRCSDVPLLRAVLKPPDDPVVGKHVDELKSELARFVALRISGRCKAAESKATDLISAVKATGYLPLLADTLNAAGILGDGCGDPVVATERLKEAYAAATASHHDQAAAEAATVVPGFAILVRDQIPVAHEWLKIGQAALQRLGPNPRIEAWLLASECAVYGAERDNERALGAARKAFEIINKTLGSEHPDTLIAEQNLGDSLAVAGRFDEGIETTRSALEKGKRVLGHDHPRIGMLSYNEGEALERAGRYPEALAAFQRALGVWRRAGSDSFFVPPSLTGLGKALLGEGRPAEAIAPLQEALAGGARKALPRTAVADTKFALARALWSDREQHARALALARQAREGFADAADPKATTEIESWIAHVDPPKTYARNQHAQANTVRESMPEPP